MSIELIGLLGIAVLIVLLYLRMTIGVCMLFVGFWGIVSIVGWDKCLTVMGTIPFRTIADYTFAAMPLFILLGMILFYTGMGTELFHAAHTWLGGMSGGLAMAVAAASALFGVITDSEVTIMTLGKTAIPEMQKYKYDDSFSTGSLMAGASLASLIPPSMGFILYALLTGNSVGKLFLAAAIPGLVCTILFMAFIYLIAKAKPNLAPPGPKSSFKEKIVSLKLAWTAVALIVVIIGGIYMGIFTPTEAGAAGSFGALLIGLVSRKLTRKNFISAILETAQLTAMISLLMAGTYVFIRFMALSQLPIALCDFVVGLHTSRYIVLAVIVVIYLLLGMFTDIFSSMLLTLPILYPVIIALGFSPLWWGVVLMILVELGFYTPPIGINAFILSRVTGVPVGKVFKGVWPLVVLTVVFLIILTIFPDIVLYLPNRMLNN